MLKKLQRAFASALTEEKTSDIAPLIKGKIPAENLLAIYRNNSFAALTQVLQLTYPVTEKLVGEGFFKYAAHEFIQNNWPKSGDMDEYGENFSQFLDRFPPVENLPYLPDVAKFEWVYQQSALAENATALAAEAFLELKSEDYLKIKLQLHPTAKLFSSKYPIDEIWLANIKDTGAEISLDSGGCQVLLLRPETRVMLHSITHPEYVFLESLQAGAKIYKAYEAAGADFPLDICLERHILNGVFININ